MLHLPQSGFLHWERPGNDLWLSGAAAYLSVKHAKRKRFVKRLMYEGKKPSNWSAILYWCAYDMHFCSLLGTAAIAEEPATHGYTQTCTLQSGKFIQASQAPEVTLNIISKQLCHQKMHTRLLLLQAYSIQKQAAVWVFGRICFGPTPSPLSFSPPEVEVSYQMENLAC